LASCPLASFPKGHMPRLPHEFALGNQIWTVRYKWNLTFRNAKVDGLCDYDAKVIWLDRSLTPQERWIAFRHEYKHAVLDHAGIGFNAVDERLRLSVDQEEALVAALEIEDEHFNIKWKFK